MSELVFRVIPRVEWRQAQVQGRVPRCGSDIRSGFIHLSTAETLLETGRLYFSREEDPIALEISATRLGDALQWEEVASRGGQRFPHLYAEAIPMAAVQAWLSLEPREAEGFALGERHVVVG